MAKQPRIPTYFSHSYRPQDRVVNTFLWDLLWKHGFLVQVDAKSDDEMGKIFSIPFLEIMMRKSACFVAALTHRPEHDYDKCSPYMLWECGLAIQARKPRLILVEKGISGRYFSPGDASFVVFDREQLDVARTDIETKLRNLAKLTKVNVGSESALLQKVGLLFGPSTGSSIDEDLQRQIRKMVQRAGYEAENINLEFDRAFEISLQLDKFDFIITDMTPGSLPAWFHPYLHGRFIPSIKCMRIRDGEEFTELPKLISSQLVHGPSTGGDTVLFWRTPSELMQRLDLQLQKIVNRPHVGFYKEDEGARYFHSIGLPKKRIFVSNSVSSNDLAARLTKELDKRSMDVFQYKVKNTIVSGADWRAELKRLVMTSDIFIGILTKDYFSSEFCREELENALANRDAGTVEYLGYLLEPDVRHDRQAHPLFDLTPEQQCSAIIARIEQLSFGANPARPSAPTIIKNSVMARKPGSFDIGIATIIEEEYRAIHDRLENTTRAVLPEGRNDRFGWQAGEVSNPANGQCYHVVIGRAAKPANTAASALVREMIELWKPRYILLVGIAGGIKRAGDDAQIERGDIIIPNVIHGYEYGKMNDGVFLPRMDFTYQVDGALLTCAQALVARNPDWAKGVLKQSVAGRVPRVVVGPVASGDKVVDDLSSDFIATILSAMPRLAAIEMEGVGVAHAIDEAKSANHVVGFIMIRGISDIPTSRGRPDGVLSLDRSSDERNKWKHYAAEVAAEFAIQFIKHSWPTGPDGAERP